MKLFPQALSKLYLILLCIGAILAAGCATSTGSVSAARPTTTTAKATSTSSMDGVISCSTFTNALSLAGAKAPFLKLMQTYSSTYQNSDTGQTIRFLAVLPDSSSSSYQTLVFFNGTSQITPDWPADLLVQVKEETSLCDSNALVFSDYPGIGGTDQPDIDDFTLDNISSNVYHLLAKLNADGGFTISSVNPIGWSLGSEAAQKFASLASVNNEFSASGMKIHNLFLIATKPGGSVQSTVETTPESCSDSQVAPAVQKVSEDTVYYDASGNIAMCVKLILNQLYELDTAAWDVDVSLKNSLVGVMFPYVDASDTSLTQSPYQTGDPTSICSVTIADDKVSTLCNLEEGTTIETACTASSTSTCSETLKLYQYNREASPYLEQILDAQFKGQRTLNFMFDYGNCGEPDADSWTSQNCVFNSTQEDEPYYVASGIVDGAPCVATETGSATSAPVVSDCPGFPKFFNAFYIFNGEEDMFIRNDYGKALCDWLNTQIGDYCLLTTYPDAGHGVLYDHGSEIYSIISDALSR